MCAVVSVAALQPAFGAEGPTGPVPLAGLPYEVVDGWAVHAGDMVIGQAEDVGPATPDGQFSPRFQSGTMDVALWDHGVVPYIIDEDFSAETKTEILAAIKEWNDKTVISLVPRQAETSYVRFQTTTERCRSHVGMTGGEQTIWWASSGSHCGGVGFLLHEIGHTVGLWHEHQRTDRDTYLSVRDSGISQAGKEWIVPTGHPADGPYNYASVMHYHALAHTQDGRPVMDTIPPGMPIRSTGDELSQGDIHRVGRLYGREPWATTITTNPPGLEIVINGRRTKTPSTHYWPHGVVKSLIAPALQRDGGTRFVFSRWNTNNARVGNIVVGSRGTWLEANYIVQHPVSASPHPVEGGSVTIDPPSPDGYYTMRTPVTVLPSAYRARGYTFWKWQLWRTHGLSSDPAQILVNRPEHFAAHFTTDEVFRIRSTVGPFLVIVDDAYILGPVTLPSSKHNGSVLVSVPPVQTRPTTAYRPARYRFEGWTDGGPHDRWIVVRNGGELVARFQTEYFLDSGPAAVAGGGSTAGPPAAAGDGYDRGGSSGHPIAVPREGWEYDEWLGDAAGLGRIAAVATEGSRSKGALFERVRRRVPAAASALAAVPTDYSFPVLAGEHGFLVPAPPDARRVTVRFEPLAPGAYAELVPDGTGLAERIGSWERAFPAPAPGHRPQAAAPGRTIVLSPDLASPGPFGTYGFRVVSPEDWAGLAGTVRVQVEAGARPVAGGVSPRALTFVAPSSADAPPQRVTLSNPGPEVLRFRFTSETPWLSAEPREGVVQPYGRADISVRTYSAGVELDTHHRELSVELMNEAGEQVGSRAVQVAFAVVPPSDGER